MQRLRWHTAGLLAFIIGVPMAEEAKAQGFGIFAAALDLTFAIVDAAGDS